jgi:hypothetical protein
MHGRHVQHAQDARHQHGPPPLLRHDLQLSTTIGIYAPHVYAASPRPDWPRAPPPPTPPQAFAFRPPPPANWPHAGFVCWDSCCQGVPSCTRNAVGVVKHATQCVRRV